MTREQIVEALSGITNPQNQKNIVESGLIENIEILSDKQVKVTFKLTHSTKPLKNSLEKVVNQVIKETFGDDVNVQSVITEVAPKKEQEQEIPLKDVKNIIAVASGKGGVGKSTITANLACALAKMGFKVGLIDADIFGPSMPKMFNLEDYKPLTRNQNGKDLIVPGEQYGVKLLSMGFFVDKNSPVLWRGPMASNMLNQIIKDGDWGSLDYLLFDLPPGTSDIHLTVVQTLKLSGAIIVSTPQQVAVADVIKGINMFTHENVNVPILGIVENMAWFTPKELPENKYYIFGKNGCEKVAKDFNTDVLAQIPLVASICQSGDDGKPEVLQDSILSDYFMNLAKKVSDKLI